MSLLPFRISSIVELFLASTLVFFMSGCSSTIFTSQLIPASSANLVSIDAKQRVILSNPSEVKKTVTTSGDSNTIETTEADIVRFCAEPSPDVFSAIASSLGAEASFGKSAALDVNAAAKIASTFSENAATIERSQTINVLREVMYRNCERYLSGAISRDEFIVQAARDQQLIVQVLAIEQITGVARAQSTALVTLSKAAAGGVTDTGIEALTSAKSDRDGKRIASKKAAADAAALPPVGACGNAVDINQLPSGVTADQAKAKNAKCDEAKSADEVLKEAEDYFAVVKKAIDRQTDISSDVQGKLVAATQTASESSKDIADVVFNITKQYQAFDEIGMTCVVRMRNGGDLPEYCKALLEQMASTRQAQLAAIAEGLDQAQVRMYRDKMEDKVASQASAIWQKLGPNFTEPQLDALIKKAGIEQKINDAQKKELLKANKSIDEFIRAFRRLPPNQKASLAGAAV